MDCYFSRESNDCIVPKYPDTLALLHEGKRYQQPDEWTQWEVTTAESFRLPDNCSIKAAKPTMEEFNFGRQSLYVESSLVPSIHDSESSTNSGAYGDFSLVDYSISNSEDSSQQDWFASAWPDHQLQNMCESVDDLGSMQMDDIFFKSLLEDVPDMEYLHEATCIVPNPEWSSMSDENLLTDVVVDSQRIMKESSCLDSSMCLRESFFSIAVGNISDDQDINENEGPSCLVPDHLESVDSLPTIEAPLVEKSSSGKLEESSDVGVEKSSMATVLQELIDVMRQMNQNTRIDFRDAFYRMAKDLKQQHASKHKLTGSVRHEHSCATILNGTQRFGEMEPLGSENIGSNGSMTNPMHA